MPAVEIWSDQEIKGARKVRRVEEDIGTQRRMHAKVGKEPGVEMPSLSGRLQSCEQTKRRRRRVEKRQSELTSCVRRNAR